MWLLPPHFWPIIYLWTMVGLSCRPAHELLWQRLKGKHLLGRLLPPWGCKKDGGNVYKDKDRGSYRHQKGFSGGRGQVRVCRPGSLDPCVRLCVCAGVCVWPTAPLRTVYIRTRKSERSPLKPHVSEDKVWSPPGRDLGLPPLAVMYCTSCSLPYPGAERGRAEGGCDIKDPPRCQMGPQLNPRTPPAAPCRRTTAHTHTTFCHINVMKTSLELGRFRPSSSRPGGYCSG